MNVIVRYANYCYSITRFSFLFYHIWLVISTNTQKHSTKCTFRLMLLVFSINLNPWGKPFTQGIWFPSPLTILSSFRRFLYNIILSYYTIMAIHYISSGVTGVTPELLRSKHHQYYMGGLQWWKQKIGTVLTVKCLRADLGTYDVIFRGDIGQWVNLLAMTLCNTIEIWIYKTSIFLLLISIMHHHHHPF